jgi:putative GTP pyrophosphokinase
MPKADEFREWYAVRRSLYEELARTTAPVLEKLLANESVRTLSISFRSKTAESAGEKVLRKGYANPISEMTDLAGVRVITSIETDIPRVERVLRSAFAVLADKSSDRSEQLGVDRTGYRSLHFVCSLGSDRLKLPECAIFADLVFESTTSYCTATRLGRGRT